ncbi:hypothetical protein NDK43_26170 [Neobacillus pocheonensis]|uniref:Uncharacterized protein n=1 Tax=Neobacillus pocheonensis TaxID=363869 RepID=A0ABT0WFV9_9BACI|nr:hypothetical protein [Neobacillus pocheonensis]
MFLIEGKKPVLIAEINKGSLKQGEAVVAGGRRGKSNITVQMIERNRKFVERADEGESISLLIPVTTQDEISFLRDVTYIVNA